MVFATDSVFELHRRLVDEGVQFLLKPERQPWGGVMVMFVDLDGNIFRAVDDPHRYEGENVSKELETKERGSGVTIRFVPTQSRPSK